jgi:cell wall-associated NlpC family hydrolase
MKKLLLYILIFSSLLSFSQSKLVKKSKKFYDKGEYEKCIVKTKKHLKKERKSADLQYYILASQYQLYQIKESQTKQKIKLKKLIKSYDKLEQWNVNAKAYVINKDSVYTALKDYLPKDTVLLSSHRYFYDALAELFGDTTSQYRQTHTVRVIKESYVEAVDSITLLRKKLTNEAYRMVGTKYKYGGVDSTGFDCSGFTQYVYSTIGVELPHNAHLQSKEGIEINLKDAQAGDLIFFGKKRASHAGMVYKNKDGQLELIHSVSGGVSHQVHDSYDVKYWMERVYKVKRILSY